MFAVTLRRGSPVRFPNRCVRCGRDPKGCDVPIWTHQTGWWTWLLVFGKSIVHRPAACRRCRIRILVEQWGVWAFLIGGTALLYFGLFPFIKPHIPVGYLRIAAIAFLIVAYLSFTVLWYVLFPRTVEMFANPDDLSFEFHDEEYAHDFIVLNDENVLE